ncbi:uncharacterized protein LOC127263028 [Andrographis paniculata]|uniref:uncharacterized protein LOC127263028 n=1 Tax=Andrographis paniculata TaxID=175694 RepID=UPI0021E99E4A|nr:uncharacterized protein LOC127263028 [Andrographis paniculata]
MLLRSSLTPQFAAIPYRFRRPAKTPVKKLAHLCTPSVRQNAAPKTASLLSLHKLPPTSAYVHLPFCRRRCHYCDFPIIALGSSAAPTDPRISNYVETICREIHATESASVSAAPLETVFFGGGTPSLVPPQQVGLILDALSDKFGVRSDAEISMEMDPGTFDAPTLRALIDLGVNRVSLGVQAFQDELLKACGRAHGVQEIDEAIDIVKSSSVENWSLDLISSLPHQSSGMWNKSLQSCIQAQPTHVSVYDLQVEQNTKFGVLYTPGEFPLPSENQSAEFYKAASRALTDAGYEHYEISSYCKSGYRCEHNTTYWKNEPFRAFGLGAASYVGGARFTRPRNLKDYAAYVRSLEDGSNYGGGSGGVDIKELATDVVMLSLRTADGLDLRAFGEAFGESAVESIFVSYGPYVESGHVMWLDESREAVATNKGRRQRVGHLRLSDPDGFLLSNELIAVAFHAIAP